MKFLDEAKIYVKSGHGGPGCVSFHREKFIEFGGPDGGNGGRGGDIIFVVVKDNNTLIDFRYAQHFRAPNGMHGMGRNRSGVGGDDLVIRIPVGTQIFADDKETLLLDLTTVGEKIVFLRGGDGGFGNAHYKSSVNQAPRKAGKGWPGSEEIGIWLRLKLIADAGLLGMPNAGKSTFLSRVSAARPKIADYPFTTLHPNLGVVNSRGREFVMADIPGLIEGASEGVGLGTRFLGHVERTKVLLHLIDITQDAPWDAYEMIRNELECYGGELAEKREVVALNKMDALGEELSMDVAREFEERTGVKPMVFSAVTGEGLDAVLLSLADVVFSDRVVEDKSINDQYLLHDDHSNALCDDSAKRIAVMMYQLSQGALPETLDVSGFDMAHSNLDYVLTRVEEYADEYFDTDPSTGFSAENLQTAMDYIRKHHA